MLQMHRSL
ncbi:hypothetical protein CIB84_011013 [Bambusicola thoracicus]|uniref:Uncharacterized protein n=1 Tax=Bambusicola thoracicus TaxID=9083 RepID=A0A2P4SE79_BAMTH|nr:hypothetical protein CIB84_013849 [Bambusicola thoracicus]POI22404.1 hypothetical protein CIB84_013850 [Bambusicola thoracicus]POI25237.1 hypothetical protein CIB84_011013 [Bambusicola thoracicus]